MKRLIWVTLLLLFVFTPLLAYAMEPLKLGALIYRSKTKTQLKLQPLANYLTNSLNRSVEITLYDLDEMVEAVAHNRVDIVYTNPSNYILLKHRYSLSAPLATIISQVGEHELCCLGGTIFARADAKNINQLADIVGKRIAAINLAAWGGYLMQAFELQDAELPLPHKTNLILTSTIHDKIIDEVISGRADVGFIRSGVLEDMAQDGKINLNTIKIVNRQNLPGFPYASSTRLYPEWAVAVMPSVAESLARKLAVALYSFNPDRAAALSTGIRGFTTPANYTGVEEVLRQLRMSPFDVIPEFTLRDLWNRHGNWILALSLLLGVLAIMIFWMLVKNRQLKQSEKYLGAERGHLHTLLTTLPDLVWLKDHQGVFLRCNPRVEALLGVTEQEMLGKTDYDFMSSAQADIFRANDQKAIQNNAPLRNEETLIFVSDGHQEIVETTKTPMYGGDGRLIGVLGIGHDITMQRQMEQQRQELEVQLRQRYKMEAVGVMAGGIAHNFNNNLSIILGNIELSKIKLPAGSEIKSFLDHAQIAVMRSRDLVKQIMTYSRKGAQQKAPLQLALIIDETITLLGSTIPSTVKLQQHISPECANITILANASQIQECLLNLCNNAVHAMDEQGELTLILQQVELQQQDIAARYHGEPGAYLCLSVKDNGCGIIPEIQEKIFDPFFTTKELYDGTGMGLSTVQGIMEQHNGMITVKTCVGQGTTFNLYFRIVDQSQPEIVSIASAPNINGGTEKILYVDDDEMLATLQETMLTAMGYQVIVMTNSVEALKLFSANADHFDLVITDQTMPELTGKELLAQIKKIRPDIPIILCTGYSSKVDAHEAKQAGASAFLVKPTDFQELLGVIRSLLDKPLTE